MSNYSDPTPGITPTPEGSTTARTHGKWRKRLGLGGVLVAGATVAAMATTGTAFAAYPIAYQFPLPMGNVGSTPQGITVGSFDVAPTGGVPWNDIATIHDSNMLSIRKAGTSEYTSLNLGAIPSAITSANLNNAGADEIVTANSNNTVTIQKNNTVSGGALSFTPTTFNMPAGITNPTSVVVGNFNNVGGLDIAVTAAGATSGNKKVVVFYLNSNLTLATSQTIDTGSTMTPRDLAVARVDAGSSDDLVIVSSDCSGTGSISTLRNTAPNTWALNKYDNWGNCLYDVSAGDFNSDGKPDLAIGQKAANALSVAFNTGNFAQNSLWGVGPGGMWTNLYGTGNDPEDIVAADLTGDGKLDIATANETGTTVLTNNGYGSFTRYDTAYGFNGASDGKAIAPVQAFWDDTVLDLAIVIKYPAAFQGHWSGNLIVTNSGLETPSNYAGSLWFAPPGE